MGRRGPKPMTKEELQLRGSYREDRHAGRPARVAQRQRLPNGEETPEPAATNGERGEGKQLAAPNLSPTMSEFFLNVEGAFALELHEHRVLCLACVQWDRAAAAREYIEEHGTTYTDRFGQPKPRPELKIETDASNTFAKLIRELNLDAKAQQDEADELLEYLNGK